MKRLCETENKIFKRLGKSVPKNKIPVRKKSPQKGVELNIRKAPPVEIYNEAIESLSHMKETFMTSKDLSKTHFSKISPHENYKIIYSKNEENENEENKYINTKKNVNNVNDFNDLNTNHILNDSFGNNLNSPSRNYNENRLVKGRSNSNQFEIAAAFKDENSFLTNNNNTLNIISGGDNIRSKKNSLELNLNNQDEVIANNKSDLRLNLVMKILDLENLFHLFNSNKLKFNDILFLTKEDLMEMSISLVGRNRILRFSESYRNHGKDYTIEEISEFFKKNKHFVYNLGVNLSHSSSVRLNKSDDDKVNFYENHVLSTANFNNEQGQSVCTKKKSLCYEDEVFLPTGKLCDVNNYTLAKPISSKSSSYDLTQTGIKSPSNKNIKQDRNQEEDHDLVNDEEQVFRTQRSDINNILESETSNKLETLNVLTSPSLQNLNVNVFAQNLGDNLNTDGTKKKETTAKTYFSSYGNSNPGKVLHAMGFRKKNVIQKDFETVTSEVEKYIKNYKELKVKSEDRNNRYKCLIAKTKNSRSKSKEKKLNFTGKSLNNNNYTQNDLNLACQINPIDLVVEEERNLENEINKIINRINNASGLSLDTNSIQQLNRIKSLANLNAGVGGSTKKNLKLVDLDMINKEIDKLYEVWNKKQNIQSNLNICNTNILENKKLLKLLEDETINIEKELSMRSYYSSSSHLSLNNHNETINSAQSFNSQGGIYYKKRLSSNKSTK